MKTNLSVSLLCSGLLLWASIPALAAEAGEAPKLVASDPGETTRGVPWRGAPGIRETVAQIMERQRKAPPVTLHIEAEPPRLRAITPRDNPASPKVATWPGLETPHTEQVLAPQTYGLRIKTIGISESGYIPPDTVGTVGPGQILSCANGRIKTHSKVAGTQSGLSADLDTLFASVNGGAGASDTHVRYDRLSGRFFIVSITVTQPNRVLIAVSNSSTLTDTSSFTFFQFQFDQVGPTPNPDTGAFLDYPTLGVDANALYIGGNIFGGAGGIATTGFVVNKADLLNGILTVTAFRQLMSGGGAGPWTPQGVDNDDPGATEGYFIGVGYSTFGNLVLRRITNPGGVPSISGNMVLTVPATSQPITQKQMGSTTNLDSVDDRLFAAAIRKNKLTGTSGLWTAHHVQVNAAGVACSACGGAGRNGSRWYQIGSLTTTPSLVEAGTLFDPAATNPRGYWFPSVISSGQGHVAIGSSMASTNDFASVVTAGRLRTDPLGTTQAATVARAGTASYVLLDPNRNRWGDFSQTVVDPDDDQTLWTFQEYCDNTNQWAVNVTQLKAPPPATPSSATPSVLCQGQPSLNVEITGTSSANSEFFDPGTDPGGPGYARRLTATLTGGVTVNSTTFVDPTHLTLNLSTLAATPGNVNVQIRNPDRQLVTANALLSVVAAPGAPTASNNGPLCEGATLELSASTVADATYAWTGPNGFTSTLQNPTIPAATAAASGDYSVTVTVAGCPSAPALTSASVLASPAEVDQGVRLARSGSSTDVTWNPAPSAAGHDVLRGALAELPVGPSGGDAAELCLANDLAGSSVADPDVPAALTGFWYLVRGENACGVGPYGFEGTNGVPSAPRTSGTCP